jgi:hypothetical protein
LPLLVVKDRASGVLFQVFNNRADAKKYPLGGFACRGLCHHMLRRPHITCIACRARKMFYGLMPRQIPVELAVVQVGRKDADGNFQAWLLWIRLDRRFAALKRKALKKLLPFGRRLPRFKLLFTLCEVFLAN